MKWSPTWLHLEVVSNFCVPAMKTSETKHGNVDCRNSPCSYQYLEFFESCELSGMPHPWGPRASNVVVEAAWKHGISTNFWQFVNGKWWTDPEYPGDLRGPSQSRRTSWVANLPHPLGQGSERPFREKSPIYVGKTRNHPPNHHRLYGCHCQMGGLSLFCPHYQSWWTAFVSFGLVRKDAV